MVCTFTMKSINLVYSLFTMYLIEICGYGGNPEDVTFFEKTKMYHIFLPDGLKKDRWEPSYDFFDQNIDHSYSFKKGTKS